MGVNIYGSLAKQVAAQNLKFCGINSRPGATPGGATMSEQTCITCEGLTWYHREDCNHWTLDLCICEQVNKCQSCNGTGLDLKYDPTLLEKRTIDEETDEEC